MRSPSWTGKHDHHAVVNESCVDEMSVAVAEECIDAEREFPTLILSTSLLLKKL